MEVFIIEERRDLLVTPPLAVVDFDVVGVIYLRLIGFQDEAAEASLSSLK